MTIISQETNKLRQQAIINAYQNDNVHFVPETVSIFDIFRLQPDMLIQDFEKDKVIYRSQWSSAY